jgi:hypothetical protein
MPIFQCQSLSPASEGPVEKPIEGVAAGLDSDEVGSVTCRPPTTYMHCCFPNDTVWAFYQTFSTLPEDAGHRGIPPHDYVIDATNSSK